MVLPQAVNVIAKMQEMKTNADLFMLKPPHLIYFLQV
jgi:hypothetical protein